ncbi:hypothetical protein ACFS5N_16475 [Mucilaginibacter ximonensis]|uniref:Uncharacterized protein n=1 Tax=Mucilaginibacter ximonensis TaxID=538021 RepID=A0ABW5YFN3_9SPHI
MHQLLFNFSGCKTFEEFMQANEQFYFCYNNYKSETFFSEALFFLEERALILAKNEYGQAIIHMQLKRLWDNIVTNINIFPYLEYDAVIDDYATDIDRKLNKVIKRADDDFWDVYFPLNYKGDRSTVRQLISGNLSNVTDLPLPNPGYRKNLYKIHKIDLNKRIFLIHNTQENISLFKNSFKT